VTPQPVTREQRAADVQTAEQIVEQAAEHWLEHRVRGQVPPPVEAEFSDAIDEYKRARRRQEHTERRRRA
jgi:hypothetical protein